VHRLGGETRLSRNTPIASGTQRGEDIVRATLKCG